MFIISKFGAQGLYLCWAQPCVLKTSKKQFLNFCRAKTVHPVESSPLPPASRKGRGIAGKQAFTAGASPGRTWAHSQNSASLNIHRRSVLSP